MNTEQKLVLDFQVKFDSPRRPYPEFVPHIHPDAKLCKRLIDQEYNEEFKNAEDIYQIADALADILYVVYFTANVYGLDMEELFKEVHRSNMTKVWPDGKVYKDEYGKVIKPATYSPARLEDIVDNQIVKEHND